MIQYETKVLISMSTFLVYRFVSPFVSNKFVKKTEQIGPKFCVGPKTPKGRLNFENALKILSSQLSLIVKISVLRAKTSF